MSKKLLSIDGKLVTVNGKLLYLPNPNDTVYAASLPDVAKYSAGTVCVTGDNAKAYVVNESSPLPIGANAFIWQLTFDGGNTFYPVVFSNQSNWPTWMDEEHMIKLRECYESSSIVEQFNSIIPKDEQWALYHEFSETTPQPQDAANEFTAQGVDGLYSLEEVTPEDLVIQLNGGADTYIAQAPTYQPNVEANKGRLCLIHTLICDGYPEQYFWLNSKSYDYIDSDLVMPGFITVPTPTGCVSTGLAPDFSELILQGGAGSSSGAIDTEFHFEAFGTTGSYFLRSNSGGGIASVIPELLSIWLFGGSIAMEETTNIWLDHLTNDMYFQQAYQALQDSDMEVIITPYTPGYFSGINSVQIKQWKD